MGPFEKRAREFCATRPDGFPFEYDCEDGWCRSKGGCPWPKFWYSTGKALYDEGASLERELEDLGDAEGAAFLLGWTEAKARHVQWLKDNGRQIVDID